MSESPPTAQRTLQPLVTTGNVPPPSSDLSTLRQQSLQQAQHDLEKRLSPTSTTSASAGVPTPLRRNAVDASAVTATGPPSTASTSSIATPPEQEKTSYAQAAHTAIPRPQPPAQPTPPPQQQQQQQQQQSLFKGQQQPQQQHPPPQPPQSNLPPRPKQTIYTFPSPPPDTADLLTELEEFYSYVEVPQVLEHKAEWDKWWTGENEFTKSPQALQLSTIQQLLSTLTDPHSTPPARSTASRHLLHIAHGTFSATVSTGPEHHLHLVLQNCRLLRQAGALDSVWAGIKRACQEWEGVSAMPFSAGEFHHAGGEDEHDGHGHGGGGGEGGYGHANGGAGAGGHAAMMMTEEEEERERERQDRLDEINAELATLLAVVYFMVECFRGEEEWGQELMALDPPMPIHLFNLVAGLREKNAKGYPVKKLLLLLWKSMLCTIGGMKDVERVKVLVREIEGLPKDDPSRRPEYRPWTKSTIPSLLSFRNETLAKYPTYTPPPPSQLLPLPPQLSALSTDQSTLDRVSAAAAPQPVKPTFSYHINANHDPSSPSNQMPLPPPPGAPAPASWQPPTPAPSPPPSPAPQLNQLPHLNGQNGVVGGQPNGAGGGLVPQPPKPKKQQYQTDQSRPFPLPFAPSNYAKGRAVPRSIEEASDLFRSHLRISSEIWQGWKVREEFRSEEMGWGKAELAEKGVREAIANEEERRKVRDERANSVAGGTNRGLGSSKGIGVLRRRMEELAVARGESDDVEGRDRSEDAVEDAEDGDEDEEADPMDPLTVLRAVSRDIKKKIDDLGDDEDKKKAELKQRRADLKRLERVELLYRHTLVNLQSAVIVLLKLLLATVTANQNLPNAANTGGMEGATEPPPDLTLEDCDILRHREITSKAVSAILILTLKWFKTSHVMKFHYFSQLLVDSNCLLLILKMFGLQEVSTLVRVRHDRPEHNFFKFCHDSMNPGEGSPRPEDLLLSRPPPGSTRSISPDAASSPPSASSFGASSHPSRSAGSEDDVELISDYSWRNFFSTINFVHVLQKLTKRKTHRVLLMVQYKSSAILKRILKVSHPTLQLYVLKVIKSQVPYCGRKWRQSNMKVITAIYLHVRPDLRDEWLSGVDVDADVEESLPHEQALRSLVRFFNTKHYGRFAPSLHRRSSSHQSHPNGDFHNGHSAPPIGSAPLSPSLAHDAFGGNGGLAGGSAMAEDVFPPTRSVSSIDLDAKGSMRWAYGGLDDDLGGEDLSGYEVDDLLRVSLDDSRTTNSANVSEALRAGGGAGGSATGVSAALGGAAGPQNLDWLNDPLGASDAAWEQLGLDGYDGEWDDVSDSESVGSWGFMRFGLDPGEDGFEGGVGADGLAGGDGADGEKRRNQWEHISPQTITALEEERAAASNAPKSSPRLSRRRSSTGPISPALRPVLFDRDDDPVGTAGSRVGLDGNALDGEDEDEGPVATEAHEGPAIDEVELIFNR
ncbi:hypothetical protein JCM10212_003238 [Sporobolomyces blumeae]